MFDLSRVVKSNVLCWSCRTSGLKMCTRFPVRAKKQVFHVFLFLRLFFFSFGVVFLKVANAFPLRNLSRYSSVVLIFVNSTAQLLSSISSLTRYLANAEHFRTMPLRMRQHLVMVFLL